LKAGPWTASLDLAQPASGLGEIRWRDQLLPLSLLRLETPASARDGENCLREAYAQCDKLVAVYGESRSWPVRIDGRWRADVEGAAAVLELVVSVRTAEWDCRPAMAVRSRITATGAWQMDPVSSGRFERWAEASGPRLGCVVFQLPGETWSCAAMVHPADLARAELTADEGEPRTFELVHHLFPERLEKGVILRGRLRCLLVPRSDDLSIAAGHYASLVSAEPPLGL
jgi:hypothetical protein